MNSTSATLPLPSEQAIAAFRQLATAWELAATENAGELVIALEYGEVRIGPQGDGSKVQVVTDNAGDLQMLRDLLTEQMIAHGFSPKWDGTLGGKQPANLSVARVEEVVDLSPSYRRVVVEGPDLARFSRGGLHFRLLFGPSGADWPKTDDCGVTQWPGGASAWHRPVYTTRDITCDGESARLSFDVFLHDGGRVTAWTAEVSPGDEVALTGPGGEDGRRSARWRGFIGDETALPAIARMLAAAPESLEGEAIICVPEEGDIQPLPHPEGVNLRWVLRSSGESPVEAIESLALPESDRHVFFAAEKTQAQAARTALLERGLAKNEFIAATYWTRS